MSLFDIVYSQSHSAFFKIKTTDNSEIRSLYEPLRIQQVVTDDINPDGVTTWIQTLGEGRNHAFIKVQLHMPSQCILQIGFEIPSD